MIKSSFKIKGSFRIKWWTFKIKGSFKREEFSRSKDLWEAMNFKIKGSFMCLVCMFYLGLHQPRSLSFFIFVVLVDSWAEWLSTRAGEKLGAATEKRNAQRWRNRCFCWFDDFQYCTWITLPAFADKFWIAGGFVNTMNLPGCNWGCSSLVRYSHPNPWKFIIMLGCYVWLLADI